MRPTIALFCSRDCWGQRVFVERHATRLAELGTLIDARYDQSPDAARSRLGPAEYIVSTWGMPTLDAAFLATVPRLRGVFYAAGSVKGWVTAESYARGVVVSSAAPMNAIPVAEYTVAIIVLSNKRFWTVMRHDARAIPPKPTIPGNYRRTVGIIGASLVGRDVLRLLKSYELDVLLYDPFVTPTEAASMGVRLTDLPTLMSEADVVSLHAPNLPELKHMIGGALLQRLKDGATFINTARGALVDETALLAELATGRIYAVLDVTEPEPPAADSPFYFLPNCIYTPHIAGSMAQECHRMADFAIDELERCLRGEPLRNEVKQETLARLA